MATQIIVNPAVKDLRRSVDFFTGLSKDNGFMHQHGFQDPDGHIWELFHMDPKAIHH